MARQRGVRSLISAGLDRLRQPTDQPNVVHGSRKAHIVAVAAQKGGVGKTTTSVNLACALAAHHDQRVLLVDIDPQGHVSSALRDSVRTGQVTLSQVLLSERPRDLLEAAMESAIDNVHLTPPDKALNETDTLLSTRVGREYILQGALTGARTHYDTIVVDDKAFTYRTLHAIIDGLSFQLAVEPDIDMAALRADTLRLFQHLHGLTEDGTS